MISPWAQEVREMEHKVEEPSMVIARAVTAYLNDEDGRKLQPETVRSKKAFLEGKLLPWCSQHRVLRLDQLRLPELREFRPLSSTSITRMQPPCWRSSRVRQNKHDG